MRYYVLTTGERPSIRAEFAVEDRESLWAEQEPEKRRAGMSGGVALFISELILTRPEIVSVPLHLEALRRWESRDDEVFEAEERGRRLQSAREETETLAKEGCQNATELLPVATDDELYGFVTQHLCQVNDCGRSINAGV